MSVWLSGTPVVGNTRLRLFCLPYAGGGATLYRSWPRAVPAELQICRVQLPGRENRVAEPPFRRMPPLVNALTEAIRPYLDRPFAIFGHSMGALVAFELARALRRAGLPQPSRLFLSSHRAPHLPDPDPPLHFLSDDALRAELRRLGGTPDEVFEHPELMELMLPLLRADFELCETYAHTSEPPLDVPFSTFGGRDDPTTDEASLRAWSDHTRAPVGHRMFEGHHLYLRNEHARVVATVLQTLRKDGLMSS
jgi:medium-chain acyl-[acyl-carrier-protein] hydrolase